MTAYFVISRNGEESFNFLSPDPDHLRRGPSHADITRPNNTSCVTKIKSIGAIVFDLRADIETDRDRNALTLAFLSMSEANQDNLECSLGLHLSVIPEIP